jgi:small-conductance mechanosensitive channel
METFIEFFQDLNTSDTTFRTIKSILLVLVVFGSAFICVQVINRRVEDLRRRHILRKLVYYISTVIAVILVAHFWIQELSQLTTFLSVFAAGLAVALHEAILSMAGWVYIAAKRPYAVGDRIEVGKRIGDVIDIGVFHTAVLEVGNWVGADQSTGRVIHLQNSLVFREPICNYTHGFEFIWNEIPVLVTFESDWEKASDIILKAAEEEAEEVQQQVKQRMQKMTSRYVIRYSKLTPIVYTSIQDCGVLLTLRYLTDVRKRRGTAHDICRCILQEFSQEPCIDFAYPTTRFYNNLKEGKPGLTPGAE